MGRTPVSAWLPVVNPREARVLTDLGAREGVNFLVHDPFLPLPLVEVRPSTIARMADAARRTQGAAS